MVSVIVPVFNVEPFIRDCLDSIQSQTFRDFECILVNDGSTDGSGRICRRYCERDPRFKYLYQKNAGVSSARNAGLDMAQGEFIFFVDPDDCIKEDFFSTMMKSLYKYDADIVSCVGMCISESDSYMKWNKMLKRFSDMGISFPPLRESVFEGQEAIIEALINERIGTVCWDKLYKKSLWQGMRFPENITLGEDTAIVPEIVTKANVFAEQPKAIYFYRQRSSSLSNHNVTSSRFRQTMDARKRAAVHLAGIAPGKEQRVLDWELSQNILDLIEFSSKQERSGSLLWEICNQARAVEKYQDLDSSQTLGAVWGDVHRLFLKEHGAEQ